MEKQMKISSTVLETQPEHSCQQGHIEQDFVDRMRSISKELDVRGEFYYPDAQDQWLIETLDALKQGGYIKHSTMSKFIHYIADMLEE